MQALLDDERVTLSNSYSECILPAIWSRNDSVAVVTLRHEKSNCKALRDHAKLFGWDDMIDRAMDPRTDPAEAVTICKKYYRMLSS
ncbi:Hypothetical protein POVR2_LOCUS244 [uncultured virus]|nr:Hypothetical protein POVR2_LOCUS244 [uncultured virus]